MADYSTALEPVATEHVTALEPFLPTGKLIRQKLAAMQETRTALIEYVRAVMEHGKHYYYMSDFRKRDEGDKGRETKGAEEEKPALTQDGARMVCSLFEVYPEAVHVDEIPLQDGHIRIRMTVAVKSYDGRIRGQGIGTCSTLESRYAYRWVFENQVPKHLDKRSMPTRKSRDGRYTFFRVPNEDIEDVMNTVTKMAFKRGHTMATLSLPCVSDAFEASTDGEAEDIEERLRMHESLLNTLRKQIGVIPPAFREEVCQKVLGCKQADIAKASDDTLQQYSATLNEFESGGIDWKSKTLLEDLSKVIGEKGEAAKEALFG